MSNEITAIAKRRIVGSQIRKSILMYMADCASDDGSGIWTSKATIAADLETTERTVQRHIADLIEMGVIMEAGHRPRSLGGYTVDYSINLGVLKELPSSRNTARQSVAPTGCHPATRQSVAPRHDSVSGKPSLEPSMEPKVSKEAREIREILCQLASCDAAQSFIAYRRKQKGKALTVTAAKRIATQLEQIVSGGGSPDDALGLAEERGWQSIQADWYFKTKGSQHEQPTGSNERVRRVISAAAAGTSGKDWG